MISNNKYTNDLSFITILLNFSLNFSSYFYFKLFKIYFINIIIFFLYSKLTFIVDFLLFKLNIKIYKFIIIISIFILLYIKNLFFGIYINKYFKKNLFG